MPSLSGPGDHATAIRTDAAEPHICKPALAGLVHQTGRPPSLTTEVQPMQSRPAASFKIRLIPHQARITGASEKCNPANVVHQG
jgi:hypothetical protein